MCFVSLAHPSAPLVSAALAAAELSGAAGRAALDAYAVGFEIEGRLGGLMNPQHYERGCTASPGTIGALPRLHAFEPRPPAVAHRLAVAASEASA
jgi:2-methylcitrate dehydratase PrpD